LNNTISSTKKEIEELYVKKTKLDRIRKALESNEYINLKKIFILLSAMSISVFILDIITNFNLIVVIINLILFLESFLYLLKIKYIEKIINTNDINNVREKICKIKMQILDKQDELLCLKGNKFK